MSALREHVSHLRVHPAVVIGGVLLLAGGWWLAVQQRADDERDCPEWRQDGQPPQIIAAGPWANWAAAAPPGLNGACNGRSVGATARAYAGSLIDLDASVIGEI
jgi:hypothetical protein